MKQEEAPMVSEVQEPIKTRPFFSIIISCYNSRKTLGALLESIVNQHMGHDIEVVISDDHSTERYDDIIALYDGKLDFVFTQTEYNCCPGNTREAGAQAATGEWITFADHDDAFIEDVLPIVKQTILDNNEKYYVITNFYEYDPYENKPIKPMIESINSAPGWTHGRFYNLDNLWKEFEVHYQKDLLSHEDVYLTCVLDCITSSLREEGIRCPMYLLDLFTYKWNHYHDSVSHRRYKDGQEIENFFEKFFKDYLDATLKVYLNYYNKGVITYSFLYKHFIDSTLLCYFYSEGFIFKDPKHYKKYGNFEYLSKVFKECKSALKINNNNILQEVIKDMNSYAVAEEQSSIAMGRIIPNHTFIEWLIIMDSDGSLQKNDLATFVYTNEKKND